MVKEIKENKQRNIGYIDFNDLVDVFECLKDEGYKLNIFCDITDRVNHKYFDKFRRLIGGKIGLRELSELYNFSKIIITNPPCNNFLTDEFENVDELLDHPFCFETERETVKRLQNELVKKYTSKELKDFLDNKSYPDTPYLIKEIFGIDMNLLGHLSDLHTVLFCDGVDGVQMIFGSDNIYNGTNIHNMYVEALWKKEDIEEGLKSPDDESFDDW